jgi:hypothetical protein
VKKMKERGVFVAHISPQETDGREREGERDLCSHVSRGSRWRRERDGLTASSSSFVCSRACLLCYKICNNNSTNQISLLVQQQKP